MSNGASLHLLIGPVGAGKSTWAKHQAVALPALFLDVDTWMVRLYGPDPRPEADVVRWYLERRERCREALWETALAALACGIDVLLEGGFVTRAERETACERAAAVGVALRVHLFDAPRDVRRGRVEARNAAAHAHTQVVPLAFFERASDAWEAVDEVERRKWKIRDA